MGIEHARDRPNPDPSGSGDVGDCYGAQGAIDRPVWNRFHGESNRTHCGRAVRVGVRVELPSVGVVPHVVRSVPLKHRRQIMRLPAVVGARGVAHSAPSVRIALAALVAASAFGCSNDDGVSRGAVDVSSAATAATAATAAAVLTEPGLAQTTRYAPVARRIGTAKLRFVHAGSASDGAIEIFWGPVPAADALAVRLQPGQISEPISVLVRDADVENIASWSVFAAGAQEARDVVALGDALLNDGELAILSVGPAGAGQRRATTLTRTEGTEALPEPYGDADAYVYVVEPGDTPFGTRDQVGYADGRGCLGDIGESGPQAQLKALVSGVQAVRVFRAGGGCTDPVGPIANIDTNESKRWLAIVAGRGVDRALLVVAL